MKSMKIITLLTLLVASFSVTAKDFFSGKVKKLDWNGLEVIYLEDDRFPTYMLNVYFADGAIGDHGVKGLTEAALSYITLGTRRFSQKDIASNLEFFGASYGPAVTHEFSSYSVSGLVKDITPTLKKICHLFTDATYPKRELKKEKKRIIDSLQNMANNPGALASRAFREISLEGTPYSYPVDGKIRDVRRWSQQLLKGKLNYLNNEVKKRIYLTGPEDVLSVQKIINDECGWKGKAQFIRTVNYEKQMVKNGPAITLIPVPKANQAQVRIGKFLNNDQIDRPELMSLASHYLGGGFTSRLMRVLRVENGLTYGVGAYAGGQKQYGRSGISTSTKVESIGMLLEKIKEVLKKAGAGEIEEANLLRAQGSLAGSYPFGFESNKAYLGQLTYLDHVGRPYESLFDFPEKIRSFKAPQVASMVDQLYSWENLHIVIIGPRSAKKDLEKIGNVEVRRYQSFL